MRDDVHGLLGDEGGHAGEMHRSPHRRTGGNVPMTKEDLIRPVDLLRRLDFKQWLLVVVAVATVLFGVNIARVLVERHQAQQTFQTTQERVEYVRQRLEKIQSLVDPPASYWIIRNAILTFRRGPDDVFLMQVEETTAPPTRTPTADVPGSEIPQWRNWLRAFHLLPETAE